jgi:hypothetical protein
MNHLQQPRLVAALEAGSAGFSKHDTPSTVCSGSPWVWLTLI